MATSKAAPITTPVNPANSYSSLTKSKYPSPPKPLQLFGVLSEPVPTGISGHKSEPELDRLSNILKTFNEQFATLFNDADRLTKRIREDIVPKVAADAAYQNAKENTPHTARMAHDQALTKAMQPMLKDDLQFYKQFMENESFKRSVADMVYQMTNQPGT